MQVPDPESPQVSVHLIRVEFNSEDGIPASARGEISTQLRSQDFERYAGTAFLKELEEEIAEVGVIGAEHKPILPIIKRHQGPETDIYLEVVPQ
jgi:hypothetical protein